MINVFDSYWKRWTLACSAGELIGIGIAAGVSFLYVRYFGEPVTVGETFHHILFIVMAGALEGCLLAIFQWGVLKEKFPALPKFRWIKWTMVITMLSWFLILLPTLLFSFRSQVGNPAEAYEPPIFLFMIGGAALGLIIGSFFGLFQWFVFKDHADEAIQWVTGNSLGWGLAMIWLFLPVLIFDKTTPLWQSISGSIACSILAALSIGALTGIYLNKIVAFNNRASNPA